MSESGNGSRPRATEDRLLAYVADRRTWARLIRCK